jgi:Rrf2 family iron-sulfur cluster assembly transcriptional regulator
MTHDLWSTLNRKMLDYLASVTLYDLVEKQRQKVAKQATKSETKTVSFSVAQAA